MVDLEIAQLVPRYAGLRVMDPGRVSRLAASIARDGQKSPVLVVAGGVGANRSLRQQLDAACRRRGVRVHYPELHLCTENGAMIALAAAMRLQAGQAQPSDAYAFDVQPRWELVQA